MTVPEWIAEASILAAADKLLQEKAALPFCKDRRGSQLFVKGGEALKAGVSFMNGHRTIRSMHYVSFQLPIEDRIMLARPALDVLQRRVICLLFTMA